MRAPPTQAFTGTRSHATADRRPGHRRPAQRHEPTAQRPRHGRGGRVLFQVPFQSTMTDSDLGRLARSFDLVTHMYSKMRPDPTSPGVARLDDFSALYLERGESDGQWVLEARTWGHPAAQTVHRWHVLAALSARELDPSVDLPERLPDTTERRVHEVRDRSLASFWRRHTGPS